MPSETGESLGHRLRAARATYGLSQRKLAARSGISNATISLIEKDSLNPSVATLFKILNAFPMTMTEFWETDHAVRDRVFFSFGELTRVNHNKVSYWLVGDNSRDSSMTFQYERYEPGMDGRELSTPVDTDIAGIVIEGKLEVTVGGQRRVLRAGDAYRFNGTVPHRFRVIGKDPVVSVSCTVPPVF